MNTRLQKLDDREFDAIILAGAGLNRLGLAGRIAENIDPNVLLPAVGQGTLSIELRADDISTLELLQPLHHPETALRTLAERAMNRRLNGGCQVPIAGFATIDGAKLELEGRVGAEDGASLLVAKAAIEAELSSLAQAEQLGVQVAEALLEKGAGALLAAVDGH